MKVKSKIKSLILLFVAFVLSAVFGVFSLNLGVKNVSGASTPADFDISGMSLRYTESGAEKAVRFHVTMTEETYNATIAKGAESGVLIIPKSLLQGNLTLSTELAVNCMFDTETWGENEEGLYEARAVLTDIPEKNYGTKLAVVAYYTLNGVTTYSEKYDNGSLAAVAVMEKEAYPDKEGVDQLVDEYATFDVKVTVGETTYTLPIVYGNEVPFAEALGLTNTAGTVEWGNRQVTGNVNLKASTSAVTLAETYELDLDINNDGTLNASNNLAFDLSALNVDSLTFGSDYTLTKIKVGDTEITTGLEGVTASGSTLYVPASVLGYVYGNQAVTFTFSYGGLSIDVQANALLISKKISNKTELDAMNTIMAKYLDAEANTYGGYFVLDANVTYADSALWAAGTKNVAPWVPAFTGLETNGFVGTFDGQGNAIEGLLGYNKAVENGFITEIGVGGTLKNVAFTNAIASRNASVVAAENNGLIENVYVHFYVLGAWIGDAGYFTEYNSGWAGNSMAVFNGGSWNATGEVKNVFVDFTDSAKLNYSDASTNANYGLSWHENASGTILLGKTANASAYQHGVYAVGIPEACANPVRNQAASDLFNWYVNEDAFDAAYGAENSAIKAEIDTWPVWLRELIPVDVPVQTLTETQKVNLDIQVNDKVVSLNESVTAILDLSEAGEINSIEKITMDGKAIEGTLDGSTVVLPVAQFGYAYGEKTITVTTDLKKLVVPVLLVSKTIKTAEDIDEFGYIAQAIGNAETGRADGKISNGYFTLGQNIAYNGTYIAWQSRGVTPLWWDTGVAQGFAGTFDGCGYTIDGMTAGTGYRPDTGAVKGNAAFIPILHQDGVIRNVAFTNAGINNSNSASGFLIATGQGVVENVYVQMTAAAGFSLGGVIFGTDNVRGVSGPTVRNVFVDTTAITTHYAGATFYAVGGNNNDKYNAAGEEVADGVADPFGIYDSVYAVVAINEDRNYVGTAFGAGGAYAGSQNYAAYAGTAAFVEAYETNDNLKATFDSLNEMFGIELFNVIPVEATSETKKINLNVSLADGVATTAATASVDLSEVAENLATVTSLTYGETAMDGATVSGTTLILPLTGIEATTYGESENLVLVAKDTEGKQYTITIPTFFVTKVITTKAELDGFDEIAQAVATTENTLDGYFELGNSIVYNETLQEGKNGHNIYTPITEGVDTDGFVGTFDGQGYAIDGLFFLYSKYHAFITEIGVGGTVKNVAFVNTAIGGKNSAVSIQNNGLIENVYVHYHAFGIWSNASGYFTNYNDGNSGVEVATFNGATTNAGTTENDATGTVRNVLVDMTDVGPCNLSSDGSYNLSWLNKKNIIYPLGKALSATYENVYATGIPEDAHGLYTTAGTELINWYADDEAFKTACAEKGSWLNSLNTSFWKIENGAPAYKYADVETIYELNADLSLNAEKTAVSTAARGAVALSEIDTDFGELEYVKYNGVDLNGEYAEGEVTFDMSGFGVNFGEQTIEIKFVDGVPFTAKVFVVSKVLYNANHIDDFGYIAQVIGNTKNSRTDGKISDGYFTLGQNIAYNGTYVAWQARGAFAPLWWDTGVAQGFAGTFDGCGYSIDGMTAGTGYKPDGTIVGNAGFIPLLHANGVIRNVAFTNAGINNADKSGGFVIGAGQGLVENVYVQLTSAASFNIGAAIFGTDNVRGVSGPTLRNVFVDTTALTTTHSLFFAVGGNSGDNCDENGVVYPDKTPADQKDGVADPFGIYDGVYAMVNNATQQGIAFGKGGAYAGSQNYAAYAGIEAFGEAYWTDETMKATIDKLDALFGLGLNFDAYKAMEIALTETQNFDLNVTPSLTMEAENVSVDLSEVGNDLGFLESATLTNGGSAYALRSASKELTGATLTDGVLTVPTSGNFDVADYGDYTLTVKTSNKYIITLPVALATGVIETKEELDSFGEIALAMGGGNGVYDGYFKLGADIEYNETVKVGVAGNVWNPWFGIGDADDKLSFTTYDSLNKVTGFQGVFDGGGYSIHGWRCHYKSGWYVNGFITKVAEGGVIRNVAFTDVVNGGMSSVITAQNDGLLENVYVHYYTNGAWVGEKVVGSFVEFNEGWTSESTATFNGANENATGTIRNVVVDMSEGAKLNTEDDPAKNGLCWLDDLNEVYPLGRAVNATYEGVYAIGIPDSHAYVMGRALSNETLGWYKDAASASEKYYKNGDLQSIINGLDTSFWKVVDGVASYKYADSKVATELDLDLVLSADKASAAPANETLNLAIGKDLGTLTSATFNEVDLDGKYNGETGMLTVNAAAFGYAYGNQAITVSFQDGLGKAHTFDVSVLLVTKTLKTKDDVTNFGYISKLCESDTKKWGGYFKLGNDIDYGKTRYEGFINPSTSHPADNTHFTGDVLSWVYLDGGFKGVFDGCGYTISNMLICDLSWKCGSFISSLSEDGIIRNVAFVNAYKGCNGGFLVTGGAGTIENVYIDIDWIGTTNANNGNDGFTTESGVIFGQTNNNCNLNLKLINCFVDAEDLKVGTEAEATSYEKVGVLGRFTNNGGIGVYEGSMDGVYVINGHAKAVAMNTNDENLTNESFTEYTARADFLAAYNSATQTREDIRNLPEWMKALIFGGEATEPAALTNFIENGFTDYAVVIGEKDALGESYSVQAGEPIHQAYNFLVSQVEKATGVKLEKSEAGDNAQHRIVIGDWTLFEGAGLSLNEGEYGVFVKDGTAYIMAYNAEDYHPAILKFLEIALGYRAYAMSGVGSSKADLTDGTTMQDTTFDGFIEYLSVNNGVVAALADSSYTNNNLFEYRGNGAWNLANADGLYAMGNKVFKENYGAWHNTFAFVDPAAAHTVNGNTYAAYTDSISTLNAYSKNEYTYSNVDYKLTSHPWFASSYSTYYIKENIWTYTSAQAEMVQTGATSSPYQLCYTAHGDATAYTDLVAYIGGQLIALANEHPEYEIFNFTQQDNGWACACESCTANGMMPSDTFLAFLDDLLAYVNNAENGLTRSPIKIAYFAYNAYLPAPTAYDYDEDVDGQQLNPNTYLVLAPIGAYYDEAMNEGTNATTDAWVSSSGNTAWYSDWSDVEAWLTMTKNSGVNNSDVKVYLWTYEINQYTWFAARDSFDAQLKNYKLFANYSNIEVIITENLWHNANVSAFGQLKAYLNSKAMMDPDADDVTYDGLVNEFFGRNSDGTFTGKGYYGPAGEYMYNMYTTMRGYLADFDSAMPNGKGKPYDATDLGWITAQISTLLGYITSANTAIDDSGVSEELKAIYKEHILIESLMPRFLDAYNELGAGYTDLDAYRTQFLTDAKAFGYIYYASGATPTMYSLEEEWFGENTVYTVAPETYY